MVSNSRFVNFTSGIPDVVRQRFAPRAKSFVGVWETRPINMENDSEID